MPAINYDTQALAYFDAATLAGSATDADLGHGAGTGGVILGARNVHRGYNPAFGGRPDLPMAAICNRRP